MSQNPHIPSMKRTALYFMKHAAVTLASRPNDSQECLRARRSIYAAWRLAEAGGFVDEAERWAKSLARQAAERFPDA